MKKKALGMVCGGQLLATAISGIFFASPVRANDINLTISPYSGAGNQGDLYIRTDQQPTGTGVIKPFLTIQQKGQEHGYNSDSTNTAVLLDDHRSPTSWVRSVKFDEIASVTLNGKAYAQFLLDINETNNDGHLLSMDKFELFSTSDPNLTGYSETSFDTGLASDGFGANASMIFNMDKTVDYTVQLDYSFNHGSGSGDMFAYIPYSLIQAQQGQNKYMVLYTSFGHPNTSSAGFEEWAVVTTPTGSPPVGAPGVPLPSTAWAGAGLMALLAAGSVRRRVAR